MDDERARLVVELAKEFIELLRSGAPSWTKAYFRFSSHGFKYGSNASWASDSKVILIDPLKNISFFRSMNEKGLELLKWLGKETGVFLLVVDSKFDYEIKFEYEDLERWKITKLGGGTGIPAGI